MEFTYKIFYPKRNEMRLISTRLAITRPDYLDLLKKEVREVFGLDKEFEFFFSVVDRVGDTISIKTSTELRAVIYYLNSKSMTLTIMSESTPPTEPEKTETPPPVVPMIAESLESFIKHLESGIHDMQETIEKNTTNTIDIIVKTAAETAANVHRSIAGNFCDSSSVKPSHDVICNGCYRPIRGGRYLCETCDDFDLCSVCKSRVNHDATHNFRYIVPTNNIVSSPNFSKVPEPHSPEESVCSTQNHLPQDRFICDQCDSYIANVRHTCTSCPDFDLCPSCYSFAKRNHPKQHIFVTRLENTVPKKTSKTDIKKTKKQSHDQFPTVKHIGVECDACDTPIEGIRYKCGNCPNYDLCETCEEKSTLIHDKNHTFVKLRRPIQSIVHMPLLPELRFLDTTETSNTPEIVSKPEEVVSRSNVLQKPLPVTPEPTINASFISDLNIPDGTVIVPKKTFIKMWKVKNTGNVDWPIGSHLLFNGGSILRPYPISRPDCFAVPVVAPNEETCITAELQAPDSPGVYTSYFCICTPNGDRFGDSLWCSIKVDEDLEPEKSHTSTPHVSSEPNSLSNSHVMVYPTMPSHSDTHDNESQLDHSSDKEDFKYETSSDAASVNHASVIETNTTYTYTDSQVSSPTASNVDVHDNYADWHSEHDGSDLAAEDYQVISPAVNPLPSFHEQKAGSEDGNDEFVFLEKKQDPVIVRVEETTQTDLFSSVHSSATAMPATRRLSRPYQSQLLQLHEMGFSSYDDLALSLLKFYDGDMERVISKLLEYP